MSINRKFFFDHVRLSLYHGEKLKQSHVDGLNFILDAWERDYWQEDDRWLAYCLGTEHHECDRTQQPITERGPISYFNKYNAGTRIGRMLGNTETGDGYLFRGRGYVQLTGRTNYTRASKKLGVDLIANPDLALRPDLAAQIMFAGMIEGWFTGRKLSQYFNETRERWEDARAIINGVDKKKTIASYAQRFYGAISYTKA